METGRPGRMKSRKSEMEAEIRNRGRREDLQRGGEEEEGKEEGIERKSRVRSGSVQPSPHVLTL